MDVYTHAISEKRKASVSPGGEERGTRNSREKRPNKARALEPRVERTKEKENIITNVRADNALNSVWQKENLVL